jgi:hypothetical protein
LVALCLALGLGLGEGCTRSEPLHRNGASSSSSEQTLPFHAETSGPSSGDGVVPSTALDPKQASGLPFRVGSQRVVPAGTLLTVELEDSLSTAKVRVGDVFTASVAASLKGERETLIERGAMVTGRVESERMAADQSGKGPASGYFRLTLSSITQDGRQFSLQTSSLFARGTFQPIEGVRVPKGRRLTFRVTAPVTLDAPDPIASR